ncbi:hypothetical protein ACFXJO_38905, partial [Streptomyces lavendulae]|uniref:hypothetical protein n=1 Tax=Streptomyces lavendulae TaxID=1914 RepID=UPI0036A43015
MGYLIVIGVVLAWVGFTIWRERGRPSSGRRSKGDAGSFYGCGGDSSCGGGGGGGRPPPRGRRAPGPPDRAGPGGRAPASHPA